MSVFISIIMVTYGHEKYIREAIEGILMQRGDFNFELIIANDASPDATNQIVSEILKNHTNSDKICYIEQEKNIGMMPNFIFALQQAQGDYIALCDGDDYWTDPYKLQKQVDFLEANPDYVLSFHKVKILKPNGDLEEDFITNVPENYEIQETLARLGNYIHTPSVVFRNVIKEFSPEFSLSPIGDYFLYMLMSERGKLKYIEEEMAVYREGVGIWSAKTDYFRNLKTAYTLALIVKSLPNNQKVVEIFISRIILFIDRFESEIKSEDLIYINTCEEVELRLFDYFLNKNKQVKLQTIQNISTYQLLKVMIRRLKKRI